MVDSIGSPFGDPGYRIVDADTHVNEPPDLWISRVPAAYRDRAPRMDHFEKGDAWVVEGASEPINFGNNASAGVPLADRSPWVHWEDIRPGGYDPKARLQEMDVDLVDAAVFYPTPRVSHLIIANPDPAFHLVLVRAYNDWLSEYCGHDPSRLGGIMMIPNRGVKDAVKEIERVIERPGIAGAMIGCYPHGDLNLSEDDDPVWKALVEARRALHLHVNLVNEYPKDIYAPGAVSEARALSDLRFLGAPTRMLQFLISGVFDRFPELRMVLAEVDAGWVPYVKEQMDNRTLRRTLGADLRTTRLPSSYIEEHFYFTYITDHFAVRNRHAIGVDRLMWSSDYPHGGSDWPNSIRSIHADYSDVPVQERDLILSGNAQRLYRFTDSQ
jgi:predicted TIM-barrel fold metal-dependent hydrolase